MVIATAPCVECEAIGLVVVCGLYVLYQNIIEY